MQYASLLALAAALLGAEAKIAFTHTPGSSVTAGEPFSIEWDGAEADSPVTITLKKGDENNLQTVALLTGNGKDGHYVWTPSKDLQNGEDYALEISQGVDETNYSGEFALSGAKAAASSGGAASSSGGVTTVVITSGTTSYTTTESGGASSGTGAAKTTRSSNSTISSATPTGGINVSSSSPTTTSSSSSSSSSGGAAIVNGPVGGLAAFLLGAAALL